MVFTKYLQNDPFAAKMATNSKRSIKRKGRGMTIHLHQITCQPILHYQYEGSITLNDLIALEASEEPFYAALVTGERLHVIVDMRAIDTIAAPLFPKLQRMVQARKDRIGQIAVVGANPYLRALMKGLGAVIDYPNMLHCATPEEAVTLIQAQAVPAPAHPAVSGQET